VRLPRVGRHYLDAIAPASSLALRTDVRRRAACAVLKKLAWRTAPALCRAESASGRAAAPATPAVP
jgi:hypothetical protein